MDLYVPGRRVAELETTLAAAQGGVRAEALVALAWHLRQRDSARALALADEAQALLADRPALQLRLAMARAEILSLRCQLDEAEAQLAEARRLLSQPGVDGVAEGDALLTEAMVAKARGQRERELDAYARSASFFAAKDQARRSAVAQAWLAYENAFSVPECADEAGAASQMDPVCAALQNAARGLIQSRRDPARAADAFLQASGQALDLGLLRHAIVCTVNAGAALQGLGDFDRAAACYQSATSLARRTGWPALIGASQTRLGAFLQELGLLDESLRVLTGTLDILAVAPPGINKANTCCALAMTLFLMGRSVEAVGPMAEGIRMYREARSTDNLAMNLIGQARILSAAGQPEAALQALDEVRALMKRHALSALQVGVYEALIEIYQRHADLPAPPDIKLPSACLHYAEAMLSEGLKISGWKAPSSIYVQLAEAWAAAGEVGRAYEYARKALLVKDQETAHKLSHPLALLRLRSEGDDDAPALNTKAASPTARLLTPKEQEILQLLARSYTNKEIATVLEMSDETVKWHLKKIFSKLEAGSRKHAVTRARTLGMISFQP